ncbi:MAG: S1 RNA-binding domain-containing protein, partial [Bifidobacteriaceae bacterium]|nr:S1 RNA-binding domain-containing protein [Bifidobacteriaceae bacterium]
VKVGQKVTVEVLDIDVERERISLSLKATQEDPWQRFARTHVPGQIVKGKVTKIVQFGVFVSLADEIEGLIHISELTDHHITNPASVVSPGEEIFVKVIDVDLDRCRVSLSLRQANEAVNLASNDFDPALYGMTAEYDENGNYKYPEGFDPESNEWLPGYEKQREEWEAEYAAARNLWLEHRQFVVKQRAYELENAEKEQEEEAPKAIEASGEESAQSALMNNGKLAELKEQLSEEA